MCNDSISYREKPLHSSSALLWCNFVVTQPHRQPGEEVGSHPTKTTVYVGGGGGGVGGGRRVAIR